MPPAHCRHQPSVAGFPAANQLLRVVGQISNAYIVADGPDGLYLIDQHAAHERVLYEAFMAQAQHDAIASQALLQPAVVALPAAQAAILQAQLAELAQIGLVVESFGRNAFLVRALPTVLGPIDPAQALQVVTDAFEEDETPLQARTPCQADCTVCKRAAVKAGQVLTKPEQMALVQALEQCQAPRTCPHGRPTMIHLSVDNLEKQFRVNSRS
jgi:DNA mismatch repair protein MutL